MAAPDDFLIAALATGANPDDWSVVITALNALGDIDVDRVLAWDFQPYARYDTLGNSHKKGKGAPIVTWNFKGLRTAHRDYLRAFCTGASADVYIRTAYSERTATVRDWKDYQCVMKWVERGELFQDGINVVREVEITFTNCIEVGN